MADVDTTMLAQQHSDIRLEQQRQAFDLSRQMGADTNEIVKEGLKESFASRGDTKDARHEILSSTGANTDRLEKQNSDYFIHSVSADRDAAREIAAMKASADMATQRLALDIALASERTAGAAALEAAKIAASLAIGHRDIERLVVADGSATRALVNDLKYHDLNRTLIERNAELVDERHYGRHWRHLADQGQYQGQWAALQNQLQAFQSQLQETRQGMVNFGTMAGVGQSSTSNNVR